MAKTIEAGTRSRKENSKAALEAAAERILETEGLPGLAYRRLAAEVGCSVGTAFNLLGTSDELVYRINAGTLDLLRQSVVDRLRAATETPADRFEAMATAYVAFALDNEPRWRALFDFAPASEEPEEYLTSRARLFGVIEETIAGLPGAAASGASTVARTLWSAIHGVVIVGVNGNRGLMAREQVLPAAVFLARALSAGIAAAPAGVTPA
jgi:AcrR family transcriptional regulator